MHSTGRVAMVTLEDDDPCGDGLNAGNGTTLAFELLDALGSFDVGRTDSPGYISDFSRGTGTLYRFILVARELELSARHLRSGRRTARTLWQRNRWLAPPLLMPLVRQPLNSQ